MVVVPNTNAVDMEAVKQDTWQITDMKGRESEGKMSPEEEEEEIVPQRLVFSNSIVDENQLTEEKDYLPDPSSPIKQQPLYHILPTQFRSKERRTIISINRLVSDPLDGSFPRKRLKQVAALHIL